MRPCQLHGALAEKNSLLGKMAESSQTLFMDLRILDMGPKCVEHLNLVNRADLADTLELALQHKRKQITILLWTAILAESEHRSFWSTSKNSNNYPHQINRAVDKAIDELFEFVAAVQGSNFKVSSEQASRIEQNLLTLSQGDGGQLLRELATLATNLEQANTDPKTTNPLVLL